MAAKPPVCKNSMLNHRSLWLETGQSPLPACLSSIDPTKYISMRVALFTAVFLLSMGCHLSAIRPEVDVVAVNRSSQDLSNVKVQFGEYDCSWGTLIKGATKGYLYYPHPISGEAVFQWWQIDRGQCSQTIDLRTIYPSGASGRLTFTLFDNGVVADFKGKK